MTRANEIKNFLESKVIFQYMTMKDLEQYPTIHAWYRKVLEKLVAGKMTLDESASYLRYTNNEVVEVVFGRR